MCGAGKIHAPSLASRDRVDRLDALRNSAGRRRLREPEITSTHIRAKLGDETPPYQRIAEALRECAGNQTRAAQLLGVSRRTLCNWLDQYELPRPRKRGR